MAGKVGKSRPALRGGGVFSLSAHKNTVERRRKKDTAHSIERAARSMAVESDIRAWALVGIASDGSAHAAWDTGGVMPQWAFAATVHEVLRSDIIHADQEEDWRPALNPKKDIG